MEEPPDADAPAAPAAAAAPPPARPPARPPGAAPETVEPKKPADDFDDFDIGLDRA
jgi:hypothetical protein